MSKEINDPFEKNVQILLHNAPFVALCDVLREKDINADEIWEAFFRLDAIEAGEAVPDYPPGYWDKK